MFIGHFGVGLAGKRVGPRVSLGTWFLAAQFVDLLWPILLLLGIEHARIDPGNTRVTPLEFFDYPISHSLLMSIVWGAAFGLVYRWFRKSDVRTAFWLGLAVVSHWFLDLIVHRPDLPMVPWSGTRHLGFGLWNSLPATVLVEGAVFLGGLILYLRATRADDRVGRWGLWGLVALLVSIWVGNLFGKAPPNVEVLAWVGNAQWLLVLFGYWVDLHRRRRSL